MSSSDAAAAAGPPAAAPPRRPGRPRSAGADEAIITATVSLLLEVGYQSMTIDRVAEVAGVAKATIYRRWSSKQELVVAAFATIFGQPLARAGSGLAGLKQCYHQLVEQGAGPVGELMVDLCAAARTDPALEEALVAFGDAQREGPLEALTEAQAAGDVDPSVDPRLLCDLMVGMVFYRRMTAMPALTHEEADVLFDRVTAGFRPR